MSGTDYTTTPNLGLFKPIHDMDSEAWGDHLNSNSDILDQVYGSARVTVGTVPPTTPANGQMWWDSTGGELYVNYYDGNSSQWVAASNVPGALAGGFLPLSGGTINGDTIITGTATLPNQTIFNFLDASASRPNDKSQLNSYLVDQSSGGSFSDMYCNIRADCTMQGNSSTGITGILSQMTYNGYGGSGGYVPFYGQMSRRTVNAGGAAQNPQLWGGVLEVIDWTNTDSAQTNAMSGIEIDMTCGNTDSANNRRGFGMYLNRANAGDVAPIMSLGMHLAANAGSYDTVLKIETPFNIAALDLRLANATAGSAHAIWIRSGNNIALDTPASFVLQGDNSGGMILAAAAGNPARIIYQPGSGANAWWSGAWEDGSFYIADDTHGTSRLVIGSAGATTLKCSSLALFDVTTPVGKRTGWGPPTGTATRTTFATTSVTLPQLAEHLKALIDDLTAYGLVGA